MKLNVSVGNGNTSIKWLALMAAHRFASTCVGGGLKGIRPLPKNVCTNDSSFLHPDNVIKETLADCQLVFVDLYDKLAVDKNSIPLYTPWAFIAFHTSEARAQVRMKLTKEKEQEVKDLNQNRLREVEEHRMASNLPKLEEMNRIMRKQLSDEETIKITMQNEWALITNSGVLQSIVPSHSDQEAIRQFLLHNYEALSHMFKYYSAVNSGGCTHTLEYIGTYISPSLTSYSFN